MGDNGVIGFVTNAGFLEASTADGLRKTLAEEFSSIYVFHLRGNARTSGEVRRKEKDNVFGMGSRAPVAISLLVKNPQAVDHGRICFHDIGDYLSREAKLDKLSTYGSIAGIAEAKQWVTIAPDAHGDWLSQRDDSFRDFIVMGDKENPKAPRLFANYSNGVKTQRDAWCYNADRASVADNMARMIRFFNEEVERFHKAFAGQDRKTREAHADSFIDADPTQISWTRALKQDLVKGRCFAFEPTCLTQSLYRPFTKQWLYFSRRFNEMVYQMPRIFPGAAAENRVIWTSGARSDFAVFISDTLVNLNLHTLDAGQCFPLYLYDQPNVDDGDASASASASQDGLFSAVPQSSVPQRSRHDALTDEGLKHFQDAYAGETIGKEDVFYYVYG
ncbi:MAG: type ISP restriction/modification enzyme, partial [Rhodanobacter sp.]